MKTKVELPKNAPTVWGTRDSDMTGKLDDAVDLWIEKPVRTTQANDPGATWINVDEQHFEQMYLGAYSVAAIAEWRGTYPETDRECIRYEGAERLLS